MVCGGRIAQCGGFFTMLASTGAPFANDFIGKMFDKEMQFKPPPRQQGLIPPLRNENERT